MLRLAASSPYKCSQRTPCRVCCALLLLMRIPREVKFVAASGSKLPALLKALPGLEGELVTVVYWGTAADSAIQVGGFLSGSAATSACLTAATPRSAALHCMRYDLKAGTVQNGRHHKLRPTAVCTCWCCCVGPA